MIELLQAISGHLDIGLLFIGLVMSGIIATGLYELASNLRMNKKVKTKQFKYTNHNNTHDFVSFKIV